MKTDFSLFGLTPIFGRGRRFLHADEYIFKNEDQQEVKLTPRELVLFLLERDGHIARPLEEGTLFETSTLEYCRAYLKLFNITVNLNGGVRVTFLDENAPPGTPIKINIEAPKPIFQLDSIIHAVSEKYLQPLADAELMAVVNDIVHNAHDKPNGESVLLRKIIARLYEIACNPDRAPAKTEPLAALFLTLLAFYATKVEYIPPKDENPDQIIIVVDWEGDPSVEPIRMQSLVESISQSALVMEIVGELGYKDIADRARALIKERKKRIGYSDDTDRGHDGKTAAVKEVVKESIVFIKALNLSYEKDRPYAEEVKQRLNEKGKNFKIVGINPTESQQRCLHAIKRLLNKTNHKGNRPPKMYDQRESSHWTPNSGVNNWGYTGVVPVLNFSLTDYYEAYGLIKKKTARGFNEYDKDQRRIAKEALRYFGEQKFLLIGQYEYTQTSKKGKQEKKVDMIRAVSSLYDITEYWFGLSQLEGEDLKNKWINNETEDEGGGLGRGSTKVTLELKPIWVKGILAQEGEKENFILRHADWIQEITIMAEMKPETFNDKNGVGRPSKYTYPFIDFLHIQHTAKSASSAYNPTIKIGWEKLARTIKIPESTILRTKAAAMGVLMKQFRISKELGYLKDFHKDDAHVTLTLNRAKFPSGKNKPEGEQKSMTHQ